MLAADGPRNRWACMGNRTDAGPAHGQPCAKPDNLPRCASGKPGAMRRQPRDATPESVRVAVHTLWPAVAGLHHLADHLHREAAADQEAKLPHAPRRVRGRGAVLATPHLAGPGQFRLLQQLTGVGVQPNPMLLQLLLDAAVTESRLARMHPTLGEPRIRKVAMLGQPQEHSIDFGSRVHAIAGIRGGTHNAVGGISPIRGGTCAALQQPQQLVAQLQAAVFTLRQPLQRANLQRCRPDGWHGARARQFNRP